MAGPSPPGREQFASGLLVGCFSPVIFLIVLVALFGALRPFSPVQMGPPPKVVTPDLPRIDPTTPAAALLPAPPEVSKAPVYLGDDLACVPELALEAAPKSATEAWRDRKAHGVAVALHLNGKEEDGFLKALLAARPDLAGLPFAMGDACRTSGDRARAFKAAAEAVGSRAGAALLAENTDPDAGGEKLRQFYDAHLAVVTQVLPKEKRSVQKELVRALSSIPRPEATRALARVAVFSTDEAVRATALEALAVRREADCTEVLVAALAYPWPAVAENAAGAIAGLKRKDLVPQLQGVLDAPDPRGPRTESVAGREETVAHELVRVNHLRNCLLCHAPARQDRTQDATLVAEVPVPYEPLPDRAGYGRSESNLLVRIDVTYLRQDFSARQRVTDSTTADWSSSQRFDFLVRRRVLTRAEAADLRARLVGESPYRRAAARALRELTGRDFEAKPVTERGPF
jgi:hypothetical protein